MLPDANTRLPRVHVHAAVTADPARFVELALDLERLSLLHPRLQRAAWLDPPAIVGSRAEVHVALPSALGLLAPIVGPPEGILTLVDHRVGERVSYRLDTDRVGGVVELAVDGTASARAITVRGMLWAKATLTRAALTPAIPLVEPAMATTVRKTIARADALLAGGVVAG